MAGEKLYTRYVPVNLQDIPALETWLGEMAEKGFFLYSFIFLFGRFTKSIPKKVRYRVEPVVNDEEYPDPARRLLYEENGWKYVATAGKFIHIFVSEDDGAQEIHTDPRIQSYTLDKLSRRMIWSAVYITAIIAFAEGLAIYSAVHGDFVTDFLLNAKPLTPLVLALLLLLCWWPIADAVSVFRLRKRLRSGIPLEHHKSYGRGRAVRLMQLVISFVLLATLLVNFLVSINMGYKNIKPLSELRAGIPVLRLDSLEQGGKTRYQDGSGNTLEDTYWRDYTLFVPVQYSISQYGRVKDGNDMYPVEMTTYYYETALGALAEPLYEDKVRLYFELINRNGGYQVLDTGSFDRAAFATDNGRQEIIAYKGNRVVIVMYRGDADLKQKLPLIAQTLL